MDETTKFTEAPITITRTFKLGDYKNLKVNIVPNELDDFTKARMMAENVIDAYAQLFIHQMITAELYDGDTTAWEEKLSKLYKIKKEMMKYEEE